MKNNQLTLFKIDTKSEPREPEPPLVEVPQMKTDHRIRHMYRINSPNRDQYEVTINCIDHLLPEDHQARVIWDIVNNFNMDNFFSEYKVFEGNDGRPATDPHLLLAIWIYAIIEGISSARTIARYCKEHIAFIWLCGGVNVNYHTLSDFRNKEEKLDKLFTDIIACLIKEKIVSTDMWAQDGMRVRAAAGQSSFRREKSLKECKKLAEMRVKELGKEAKNNPTACTLREKAARERAARERLERANNALEALKDIRKTIDSGNKGKKEKEKRVKEARASTTDSEARKIKMPNGGFNPAFNFQFVSDTHSQIVTGIDVINSSSDGGQMVSMSKKTQNAYGMLPDHWGADGGYYKKEDIEKLLSKGCIPIAPIPEHVRKKNSQKQIDAGIPLPGNSKVLDNWIERMETEEMKEMYKKRASTAECVNADARNKGLYSLRVRGKNKARCTAFLFGLTHNIMRLISFSKQGIISSLCPA